MDEDEAKAGAHAPSWEAEIAMEGREGKQEEAVEGSDAAPHDPEAVLGEEKEIHAMSSSITARIDEMGARIESLDTHVDQLMDRSKAASEAAEPSGEGG
eukprot:jgi/Pico_ML_1/51470/g2497.t1